MLAIPKQASIYYCGLPVDLRKGYESLACISYSLFHPIPSEAYFIFLNRKRNRMKILCWTSLNLSYWFVRSRKGVFAPKKTVTCSISRNELDMILSGNFPCRLRSKEN